MLNATSVASINVSLSDKAWKVIGLLSDFDIPTNGEKVAHYTEWRALFLGLRKKRQQFAKAAKYRKNTTTLELEMTIDATMTQLSRQLPSFSEAQPFLGE
jgi:hypothetical protein